MRKLLIVLVLMASSQLTSLAKSHSVIVELQNESRLPGVKAAFRATDAEQIPGTSLYLLRVPVLPSMQPQPQLGVQSIELDDAVTLRPTGRIGILKPSPSLRADWYALQPAMKLVRADKALAVSTGRGVVIADLNSRVDVGHAALIGHLTGGRDFISERAARASSNGGRLDDSSAAFLDDSSAAYLDDSSAAFLDDSSAAFLDEFSAAFLDESSASFLDESSASFLDATNPAHGHGTFCAGLLAAVAPDAMIMPLRVFDDNGHADAFIIAKAIHYAVKNGADVINMSFGLTIPSQAVKRAIQFATDRGVIVVASAGNTSTTAAHYPASYKDVLAVAATDLMDKKATFSNYGESIFVTAPGVNIISAYPGGYYALASGTSFSAPFVAGEAALLQSARRNGTARAIAKGAVNIDAKNPDYAGQLGNGRIDMLRSLKNLDNSQNQN